MNTGIAKLVIAFVAFSLMCGLQWARAEDSPLTVKLTFSTDGGQTYSAQPQMTAKPGILKVRATFEHTRPEGENDAYLANMNSESDFASALCGKQNWLGGPKWYQRPNPAYLPVSAPQHFDFDLDLGARSEGVMGKANRWDPVQQKQVDAPLPACPALGAGKYTFEIRVYYTLHKATPKRKVEGTAQFTLNFAKAAQAK